LFQKKKLKKDPPKKSRKGERKGKEKGKEAPAKLVSKQNCGIQKRKRNRKKKESVSKKTSRNPKNRRNSDSSFSERVCKTPKSLFRHNGSPSFESTQMFATKKKKIFNSRGI